MKILLIRHHEKGNINARLPLSINAAQGEYPPLGLGYIAAVLLREGHNVEILDSRALKLTTDETREEIRKRKPDIVGTTAMTPGVHGSLEALRLAKEAGECVTVIGGPQMAAMPRETMSYPFVDYGIIGEGEYAFLELVNALEKGTDVSGIEGIARKKGGKVHLNGAAIVNDLDSLPFPARELMPNHLYSSVIALHPFTTMITSRGCPFRCGFCFKQPSDAKVRWTSPSRVVDEMEHAIKTLKAKEIMFYDDTLTMKREHVEGICNEILERGIDIAWESPTRVNCIDESLVRLMRKSGCIRLRYGVESGDHDTLKLMRKDISFRQVEKAFKLTHQAGMETFAYFIIGYIRETPDSIRRTISLAKKLNPDWVMFTVATPFPKTNLFDLAVEDGFVKKDYWSKFTLGNDISRLPYFVPDSDKWAEKAYRQFYIRPSFILKKMYKLRSLDTLEKYIRGFKGIVMFKFD